MNKSFATLLLISHKLFICLGEGNLLRLVSAGWMCLMTPLSDREIEPGTTSFQEDKSSLSGENIKGVLSK